ncbi:MAG TPA: hypothetical protein VGQ73_06670 [Gemmatimonadales bacterium]|jgi:hypothetical protein|nr:hypothetical protein [Gemmatimonadales bacterium]
MSPVDKRVKKGARTAAALATDVGKKAAKKVVLAADTMLMKLGEAAAASAAHQGGAQDRGEGCARGGRGGDDRLRGQIRPGTGQ